MEKTKKYKNPPLSEAVFELFFQSDNWTPATIGTFYSLVKEKYPNISESTSGFGISVGTNGVQVGSGNNNFTQFKSQDNTSIIQLSNNLLTVNKLPHYSGWESYKEMINEAIGFLNKVLNITAINRIGLKAINKIDIESHNYENLKKYFNVYPILPEVKPNLKAIQLNYETPNEDNSEILGISLATINKEPKLEAPVLFQLYYTKIKEVEKSNIKEWLELAHEQLHNSFESILTKECKTLFENEL